MVLIYPLQGDCGFLHVDNFLSFKVSPGSCGGKGGSCKKHGKGNHLELSAVVPEPWRASQADQGLQQRPPWGKAPALPIRCWFPHPGKQRRDQWGHCARQLPNGKASDLSDTEKGPVGYVSPDKTLKGFQLSSRGRLDLALTTNTVNHIIAVSQKRSENGKV